MGVAHGSRFCTGSEVSCTDVLHDASRTGEWHICFCKRISCAVSALTRFQKSSFESLSTRRFFGGCVLFYSACCHAEALLMEVLNALVAFLIPQTDRPAFLRISRS